MRDSKWVGEGASKRVRERERKEGEGGREGEGERERGGGREGERGSEGERGRDREFIVSRELRKKTYLASQATILRMTYSDKTLA